MKRFLLLTITCCYLSTLLAQFETTVMQYEPNEVHPHGQLNPAAPAAMADFAPIIGTCDCTSLSRNPDGSWQEPLNMVWKFKYIMNGMAIQDEVWRENGLYAGSIRQYHADSAKWVVTYFSSPGVSLSPGVWLGEKEGEEIILYKDQQAPNGMKGDSRLTFHAITEKGFQWKGEWVSKDGQISYPFWTIDCQKR